VDFLFGSEIVEYVNVVYEKAVAVYAGRLADANDREHQIRLMNWFTGQMQEAKKKFGKYISFPEAS
jgi:hypothetical protein